MADGFSLLGWTGALLRAALGSTLLLAAAPALAAQGEPAYGPELQGFDYPCPVEHFRFTSQGEALDMAYMDVTPEKPNGADRRAAARQEFLRRDLGSDDRRAERRRAIA